MHGSPNLQPYLRDCEGGKEWVFPIGSGGAHYRKLTREHAAKLIYELAGFLAGNPVHPKDMARFISRGAGATPDT